MALRPLPTWRVTFRLLPSEYFLLMAHHWATVGGPEADAGTEEALSEFRNAVTVAIAELFHAP